MSKINPHKNQKCTKRSFGLLNIQSDLCAWHECPQWPGRGIESALPSSDVRLKQSALTIRPRRHIFIRNNKKYIRDSRSNFITTDKKNKKNVKKLDYGLYSWVIVELKK